LRRTIIGRDGMYPARNQTRNFERLFYDRHKSVDDFHEKVSSRQ
jgi:hypothetical protein